MRAAIVLLLLLGCAMAQATDGADIVSFAVVNYNPRVTRIVLRCVGVGGGLSVVFRSPDIGRLMRRRDTIFCSRYALDIYQLGQQRTPWVYPYDLDVSPGDTVCVEVAATRVMRFVTCSQKAD